MNESQLKLFSDTFADFSGSEAFRAFSDEMTTEGMSLPEENNTMEQHARRHIYRLGVQAVLDRIKFYSVHVDPIPDPFDGVELEDEDLDDDALDLLSE
jgi:hypothetical protein